MTLATPPAPGAPRDERRRRMPWLKPVAWGVGVLVVLIVAFFVADAILRATAQNSVRDEITKQLPPGVTVSDLNVRIGGFSVIGQYLAGSFERVELSSPHVTASGTPLAVDVVAEGVSPDLSKPVEHIAGTITITQHAADSLVSIPGISDTRFEFGDSSATVSGVAHLLGLPVTITADVQPSLASGGYLELTPSNVTVTAANASVNLTGIAQAVIGGKSYPVCTAALLPDGVAVTDITLAKGTARVALGADDLVLDQASLQKKGSCA